MNRSVLFAYIFNRRIHFQLIQPLDAEYSSGNWTTIFLRRLLIDGHKNKAVTPIYFDCSFLTTYWESIVGSTGGSKFGGRIAAVSSDTIFRRNEANSLSTWPVSCLGFRELPLCRVLNRAPYDKLVGFLGAARSTYPICTTPKVVGRCSMAIPGAR